MSGTFFIQKFLALGECLIQVISDTRLTFHYFVRSSKCPSGVAVLLFHPIPVDFFLNTE